MILTIDILLICVAYSYIKTFEQEDEDAMDNMMMDEDAAMMMDAPEEAAEGGNLEKSSHLEKSS